MSIGLIPSRVHTIFQGGQRRVEEVDPLPDDRLISDGAVVERLAADVEVEMEVEGAVQVAIGSTQDGPHYRFPDMADMILSFVGRDTLAALERFVPSDT